MLMNPDGSSKKHLDTARDSSPPLWSPDGSKLAYEFYGRHTLRIINVDGTDDHPVAGGRKGINCCDNYDWAPNGERLVYEKGELWSVNVDGSGRQQLTDGKGLTTSPLWSPDGTEIAYVSDRTAPKSERDWEIYVMDENGSNEERLTYLDPAGALGDDVDVFDWSPDSHRILFNNRGDIWSMNRDGTDQIQLTTSPTLELGAMYSPDGDYIAFTRGLGDSAEIFVMRSDGSDTRRMTHDSRSDWFDDWSPLGTRLVYWTGVPEHWAQIRTISLEDSDVMNLTPRDGEWFGAAWHT
jgi:TolB protein